MKGVGQKKLSVAKWLKESLKGVVLARAEPRYSHATLNESKRGTRADQAAVPTRECKHGYAHEAPIRFKAFTHLSAEVKPLVKMSAA